MTLAHRWLDNTLLASLPDEVRQRLAPGLALVTLPLGQVLHEPGAAMSAAYFPVSSIVAKLVVMEDGTRHRSRWSGARAWSACRCSSAARGR